MAAYVLADVEVHDPVAYEEYRKHVLATLQPYGGRFIIRGGKVEVLEGDWQPGRLVTIEFPDIERARQWYASTEYQEILPIRQQNSRSRLILVEGA